MTQIYQIRGMYSLRKSWIVLNNSELKSKNIYLSCIQIPLQNKINHSKLSQLKLISAEFKIAALLQHIGMKIVT